MSTMPVMGLIIEPSGAVMRTYMAAPDAAYANISASLDVVAVHHPYFAEGSHVLFIDDHGVAKRLPINFTAWYLYGGSPIHGVAVLGHDDQEPLSDAVIALITAEDFPPGYALDRMTEWLEEHGYPT